jgi:1,4-alpha-glucan branching enzyme
MDVVTSLAHGQCGDPFAFLGIHPHTEGGWVVRAFIPWATSLEISRLRRRRIAMTRVGRDGLWEGRIPPSVSGDQGLPPRYRLAATDSNGREWLRDDPYRFLPTLDESRVEAFLRGTERRAHQFMGAHRWESDGVRGTRFAVWAPHAVAVNLMGDMNGWDGRCHPMRSRGATGVWEIFVPGVAAGTAYKYQVVATDGSRLEKADPFGRGTEVRPASASTVVWDHPYRWLDGDWITRRAEHQSDDSPASVYEVHLGSWRRRPDGQWLTYRELAETLLPYVKDLGFTHVELLPVTEHPLDQSWGYQPVGFFAPTSRYGSGDDFRYFVDRAHQLGLGVILDWVPGHFARDEHGLVFFDGTRLFEHIDPKQAEHPDWGTVVFDYGKPAVCSFLISSALYWLEEFHVDGLRLDAVASMLYLDYSRGEGDWTPNREGGNANLEAVDFLRALNDAVHEEVAGAITVAEESTAWPRVSHGTDRGGLGFDGKWNMGWMNDTLEFMGSDPVHRRYEHDRLTFSMMYAFSERFVLPLSHDEVVHGKGSLLNKMPGDHPEKFANLRLLLAYQWMHPGKKLLFMGGELGQWAEWNVEGEVDWALEAFHPHAGLQRLVRDLNGLYSERASLHALDYRAEGFEWLDPDDSTHSTLSFMRWGPGWTSPVLVAANFTPVCRDRFVLPVPFAGRYRVLLNTDAPVYGGWGTLVPESVQSQPAQAQGRDHAVTIRLPGLALLALVREED